jgi:hypothetical protein
MAETLEGREHALHSLVKLQVRFPVHVLARRGSRLELDEEALLTIRRAFDDRRASVLTSV